MIVFKNSNFVIVNKPSGWLTVPARFVEDPRPVLGRKLEEELGTRLFPVHRLDFEVSGLCVFAFHEAAHRSGQRWFEHSRVGRVYQAWTTPAPDAIEGEQVWRSKIVRGKKRSFVAEHGQAAETHALVIARNENFWQWRLEPKTGRPHQLRMELSRHGAPILGDVLYGGKVLTTPHFIALRATELSFASVKEREEFNLPEGVKVDSIAIDHLK